jgi:hypothetical protein
MRLQTAVLFLSCLFVASSGFATKPCPGSPCESPHGTFDRARCESLADWVAAGSISEVVHHPAGPPMLKDFAEFTFTIRRVEKGDVKAGQILKFRVGWCQNAQTLPPDTSGEFRFFGLPLPKDPAYQNEYLYFTPVEPGEK